MFKKVLIANRGEIALRVIRACRELGVRTVAVHSTVDRDSLHVTSADESFCVGPGPVSQSYLNIPNVLSAGLVAGADAVHPGYGFLAENPDFVEICESHGLVFIGPSAHSMRLMGDKSQARETVQSVGVPVLPGTKDVADGSEARKFGDEHGYPIMIKAAAGGGGKGMRVARDSSEISRLFDTAKMEAQAAFGDGRIYLEKFLPKARHIEFQIMADQHGNVVHLGERDCSVQRRNQKLIEESPSLVLPEDKRREMGEMAVKAAQACNYEGAGTVEFLYDAKSGGFYFLEMNTRIQVEHPVTEMVSGLDLVKEQISVAAGERMAFTQDEVSLFGHAVECRINAERPDEGFAPSMGTITRLHFPGGPGVRVDTYLQQGSKVQPFYDSLLAKIITHGRDREEALKRMERVLRELKVEGIETTAPFHLRILANEFFRRGEIHTTFIENEFTRQLAEV